MNIKDYYDILELPPDASQDQIKEQYKLLVLAWHPDKFRNPHQKLNADDRTKEINEAYATLRDPEKRAEYDAQSKINQSQRSSYSNYTQGHQQTEYERNQSESERRAEQERQQQQLYADYWKLLWQ